MNNAGRLVAEVLSESGFEHRSTDIALDGEDPQASSLVFENSTVIGFVLTYETIGQLINRWKSDGDRIALKHRKELQAARQKAWNVYLVLLSEAEADFNEALVLGQIEEDLKAMRKIARAGVNSIEDVRNALLPLLPFRAAPVLSPIDLPSEIRARASDVDADVLTAFLSNTDETTLVQILEDRT